MRGELVLLVLTGVVIKQVPSVASLPVEYRASPERNTRATHAHNMTDGGKDIILRIPLPMQPALNTRPISGNHTTRKAPTKHTGDVKSTLKTQAMSHEKSTTNKFYASKIELFDTKSWLPLNRAAEMLLLQAMTTKQPKQAKKIVDTRKAVTGSRKEPDNRGTSKVTRRDQKKWVNVDTTEQSSLNMKEHTNVGTKEHVSLDSKEHATVDAKEHANVDAKEHANVDAKEHANVDAKEHVNVDAKEQTNVDTKQHVNVEMKEHVNEETKEHVTADTKEHVSVDAKEHVIVDTKEIVNNANSTNVNTSTKQLVDQDRHRVNRSSQGSGVTEVHGGDVGEVHGIVDTKVHGIMNTNVNGHVDTKLNSGVETSGHGKVPTFNIRVIQDSFPAETRDFRIVDSTKRIRPEGNRDFHLKQIRIEQDGANISQLGDKGSIKFEHMPVKTVFGDRDVNWIVRIQQVVFDEDTDEGKLRQRRAALRSSDGQYEAGSVTDVLGVLQEAPVSDTRRRLLAFGVKDNTDVSDLSKNVDKDRSDLASDASESGGEDVDGEAAASSKPDISNIDAVVQKAFKSVPYNAASHLVPSSAIGPADGNMPLPLKLDLQNGISDRQNLKLQMDLFSKDNMEPSIENAMISLKQKYNYLFNRNKIDDNRETNYGSENDDDGTGDDNINELIKDSEDDERSFKAAQAVKLSKRSVQDVRGRYGVAVNDDNDSPKEYDIEEENGVRDVQVATDERDVIVKRQVSDSGSMSSLLDREFAHKNNSMFWTEGAAPYKDTRNSDKKKQHHRDNDGKLFLSEEATPTLVGVVLIPVNSDGTVKEDTDSQSKNAVPYHHLGNHHRKHCNKSHSHNTDHVTGEGRTHPCHHGRRKNHQSGRKSEHHVVGRTDSQQTHSEAQRPEEERRDDQVTTNYHSAHKSDHEKGHDENRRNENHAAVSGGHGIDQHGKRREDIIVETFRSEQITGAHTQRPAHTGNAVHVLVILSIFLVCFTVILFLIVRNRSGSHVREINSRTALYVPQAKY